MTELDFGAILETFFVESAGQIEEIETLLLLMEGASREGRRSALIEIRRYLHTLKGNAGMVGFVDVQRLAHSLEDLLPDDEDVKPDVTLLLQQIDTLREVLASRRGGTDSEANAERGEMTQASRDRSARGTDAVRLSSARLDALVALQHENLILRSRLAEAIGDGAGRGRARAEAWEEVELAWLALEKNLRELHEQVTGLALVPLESVFKPLTRTVRDEAAREGKEVRFTTAGGSVSIEKSPLEVARDTLGHLVRNAVIHGIEAPARRAELGKSPSGELSICAALDGNEVQIEVSDDGAGVDLRALAEQAKKAGVQTGEDPLSLLFEDGVSTRDTASLGAGRGVGLGAVRMRLEDLGGSLEVKTEAGSGTTFRVRLPVTTSVLQAMLIAADGETYALPLWAIADSLRFVATDRHDVNHAHVLQWREEIIPVSDVGCLFGTKPTPRDRGYLVVLEVNGRHRGIVADSLLGVREIVTKGLDSSLGQPPGILGTTILGDGRVILILDPNVLQSSSLVSYGAPVPAATIDTRPGV